MRALVVIATLATLTATSQAGIDGFGTGIRVVALGDVTGDGDPDFATMRRGRKTDITVVSTASTTAVWSLEGNDATAVPDQDGDDIADVVIVSRMHTSRKWAVICKGTNGPRSRRSSRRARTGSPSRAPRARTRIRSRSSAM